MKMPFFLQRRRMLKRILQYSVLGLFALSTPLVGSLLQPTQAQPKPGFSAKVINVGYFAFGDLVKAKKVLEPRFQALGVKVNWVGPFPAGPQLIESLNAGRVDVGSVGESPPIFAQAAGITEVAYLATGKPNKGESSAIVVRADSPIKKIADLKGRKITFQRGSGLHYFVVRALKEVGLKITDVQAVNLTLAESRDAFIQNKIDVWVAFDPFFALVQKTIPIRILRNAAGISTSGGFYIGRRQFVNQNPELVRVYLEEVDKLGEWAEKNPSEVAKVLSTQLKIDAPILETVARRRTYRLKRLAPAVLGEQQKVADFYFEEKIIPRQVNVKDILLTPQVYEAITPKRIN